MGLPVQAGGSRAAPHRAESVAAEVRETMLEPQVMAAAIEEGLAGAPVERSNILIVDDRLDKRVVFRTILEELDQNIVTASSGEEALRWLLDNDCAVILLDVNMPLWLAPVQVVAMNVTDRQESYVRAVEARLREAGFRVASDLRNEKITYKIREHSIQKLPYQLVLGDKEVAANTVSARTRAGENLAPVPLEAFISRLQDEVAARK